MDECEGEPDIESAAEGEAEAEEERVRLHVAVRDGPVLDREAVALAECVGLWLTDNDGDDTLREAVAE